jgi:hypothetical protein
MTPNFPPPPGPEQPLWRHMHYAASLIYGGDAVAISAELLALADRIAPLEREPGNDSAPDCPIWARWDEIRELLAVEANTAWLHSKDSTTTPPPREP